VRDPFLAAHRVGRLPLYNLGGRLSPISIRDQMVRACLLVDRLVEEARSSGNDPTATLGPLLVVGAGACGATAAIAAAEYGITTWLIDAALHPFDRQLACTSRFVDPTQYDWPTDHCWRGSYPWERGRPVPLPWRADTADQLARRWRLDLLLAFRRLARFLSYHGNTTLTGVGRAPGGWAWQVRMASGATRWLPARTVVLSIGFGNERCTAPSGTFRSGFFFWQTDPFESPNCGVPPGTPVRALISGSGDGALQDFLRLATGKGSAAEIYHDLGLSSFSGLEAALQSAHERARPALAWGRENHHDHPWHQQLQGVHEAMVDEVLKDGKVRDLLRLQLTDRFDKIWLVYRCTHFTNTYPLNRFLVLLIAAFCDKIEGSDRIELRPGSSVTQVDCDRHVPSGHPIACHGKDHTVQFEDYPDCRRSGQNAQANQLVANVVILRHGVDAPRFSLPHAHPRQILPYSLR
jgi:hypothetical protein